MKDYFLYCNKQPKEKNKNVLEFVTWMMHSISLPCHLSLQWREKEREGGGGGMPNVDYFLCPQKIFNILHHLCNIIHYVLVMLLELWTFRYGVLLKGLCFLVKQGSSCGRGCSQWGTPSLWCPEARNIILRSKDHNSLIIFTLRYEGKKDNLVLLGQMCH